MDGQKSGKMKKLLETINNFLNSSVLVTDLQVFILDATGEMDVFDPSTAGKERDKPKYAELEHIKKKLEEHLA